VGFYSAEGDEVGSVKIQLKSKVKYYLNYCTTSYPVLPTQPPSTADKIWRITLTRTAGVRLKITCNGIEVLSILMSDNTCSRINDWSTRWTKDVGKIMFDNNDKASDYFKPGK
jgi:hypothetical protein